MAPIARWLNDTIRIEEIRTALPAGDSHSAVRFSTPARKSSTRSWERSFAVADVEGLVIDKQADDLAVGHVDELLAGLGRPYSASA